MLDDMHKFYSKVRHELCLLYIGDARALKKDKEINKIDDHKQAISEAKRRVKYDIYKNFIIKFDKDERPNKKDYTEILYYLSIDGYIPHIDTLEII